MYDCFPDTGQEASDAMAHEALAGGPSLARDHAPGAERLRHGPLVGPGAGARGPGGGHGGGMEEVTGFRIFKSFIFCCESKCICKHWVER